MNVQQILEEYRKGDDGRRLSFYLDHRELREHFDRIDEESSHDDFVIKFPWWTRKHRLAKAA